MIAVLYNFTNRNVSAFYESISSRLCTLDVTNFKTYLNLVYKYAVFPNLSIYTSSGSLGVSNTERYRQIEGIKTSINHALVSLVISIQMTKTVVLI